MVWRQLSARAAAAVGAVSVEEPLPARETASAWDRQHDHHRPARSVPAPVVTEVGYLLGRPGGAKIEASFLRFTVPRLRDSRSCLGAPMGGRGGRAEAYADFPFVPPEAGVVAERFGFNEVAAVDRRQFHAVRRGYAAASSCYPVIFSR